MAETEMEHSKIYNIIFLYYKYTMCNKKIYHCDLQTDANGIINVNISQMKPELIGVPLSITVKQIIMQLRLNTKWSFY